MCYYKKHVRLRGYSRMVVLNEFIDNLTELNIAVFELPPGSKKPQGVNNNGWQKTKPGSVTISPNANYGIIVPYGYIVIDADLYKPYASDSWAILHTTYNLPTQTFTCKSARGGMHYWYRLPGRVSGEGFIDTIPPKHPQFLGIDFLTLRGEHASYVVGPGSRTSDGVYEIVFGGIRECATLPLSLYEELVRPHTSVERLSLKKYEELHELIDEDFERTRYIEWLKQQPGASDGEGRDAITYRLAAEGHDYGLTEQATFNCLRDFWNDRNTPPLPLPIIAEKVTKSYKYSKDEQGIKSVHVDLFEGFQSTNEAEQQASKLIDVKTGAVFDWYDDTIYGEWDMDVKTFKKKPTSRNLRRIFQLETICDGKYTFRGLIRYDQLAERPMLTEKPFWRAFNDTSSLIFSDSDAVALKFFFTNRFEVEFNVGQILECILETAKRDPYHPVKEWLESIEWDGDKRLEHLFLEYFEIFPTDIDEAELDYRKSVAKGFILAAIERVFSPGCKIDEMLVLAGGQRTGKSEFVQAIGNKYTAVCYSIATDHRSLQALQGSWVVEFPELVAAKKADVDSIKAFLSNRTDKFIPLHGKTGAQEYPRKSVYVWTLNPPPDGFLRDVTGERRFLIIPVTQPIDFWAVAEDREQIFAEAMVMYRAGVRAIDVIDHLHRKDEGRTSILENMQAGYTKDDDPWTDIIREYLASREPWTTATQPTRLVKKTHASGAKTEKHMPIDRVDPEDIYMLLGMHSAGSRGQKEKRRISISMKRLGYDTVSTNGKRGFEKLI